MFFMSLSHQKEVLISEPYPCPECGENSLKTVVEDYELSGGIKIRRLKHLKCTSCGLHYFDDNAMHKIQKFRRETTLLTAS